jgi:hypothetical protein
MHVRSRRMIRVVTCWLLAAMPTFGPLTVLPASANHIADGRYEGTYAQDGGTGKISFEVSADGSVVKRFGFWIRCGSLIVFTGPDDTPIANHRFNFARGMQLSIEGSFPEWGRAEGTLRVRQVGSNPCDTGTLTWTATAPGAPPPPGPPAAQPAPTGQAAAGSFCRPGESPQFRSGFLALKEQLGATMGDPIECEHPDGASGDTLMRTTTGLAFYRKATNTPTFTDGYRHWALTPAGRVYWEGDAIDPPGAAAPPPAPAPSAAPAPPPPPPAAAAPAPAAGRAPSALHNALLTTPFDGSEKRDGLSVEKIEGRQPATNEQEDQAVGGVSVSLRGPNAPIEGNLIWYTVFPSATEATRHFNKFRTDFAPSGADHPIKCYGAQVSNVTGTVCLMLVDNVKVSGFSMVDEPGRSAGIDTRVNAVVVTRVGTQHLERVLRQASTGEVVTRGHPATAAGRHLA